MAVFRCGRFPVGEVPIRTRAGIVTFVDGWAEVHDPELADALREVDGSFQITDVDGGGGCGAAPATSATGRPPSKSAPKAAWVAWAVQQGMDPGRAGDLTKAQLFDLCGQTADGEE